MRDKYFSFFLVAELFSAYVSDGYVRAVFYVKFKKEGIYTKPVNDDPWYHITGTYCWLNNRLQSF